LGKSKTPKRRKNRFKKRKPSGGPSWGRRLVLVAKLGGLMSLLLVISTIFVFGYAAVTHSDFFRASSIVVDGLSRLTQKTILDQAGLAPGDNLLAVNLHLVRKRLLGHPWIAAVRVTREIPETIGVQIQEHKPLAIVDLGRRFLLNSHGRIFKELGAGDPQNLPVITGIRYTDISLGDDSLSPAVNAVVKVLKMSKNTRSVVSYPHIEGVHYDQQLGITLISRDRQRAYRMGFAPFEAKYQRLAELVPRLTRSKQWKHYQSVDLNNPDRIVVQLGSPPIPKGDA
jgi:cell division protein FtsQ